MELAPYWQACARRALVGCACLAIAAATATTAGCVGLASYRDYAEGERVALGDGTKLTVPPGYNALWSKGGSRLTGSQVSMSTGDMAKASTVPADSIDLARLTNAQVAWWIRTDSKYRSMESTGVYPPGFSEFAVGDGWTASVTTRNESRPNRRPVVIMLANLTSQSHSPIRVMAFFQERSMTPSVPPDPAALFERVRKEIALSLP